MSVTTYAHKKLCQPQFAPITNAGALVTNAAGEKTSIRLVVLANRTESAVTVVVYHVPGNAGATQAASDVHGLHEEILLAKQSREFEWAGQGLYLDGTCDTLQVKASTANAVACHVFGGRETA